MRPEIRLTGLQFMLIYRFHLEWTCPKKAPTWDGCYKAASTVWKRFFRLVQNKVMKSFPLLSDLVCQRDYSYGRVLASKRDGRWGNVTAESISFSLKTLNLLQLEVNWMFLTSTLSSIRCSGFETCSEHPNYSTAFVHRLKFVLPKSFVDTEKNYSKASKKANLYSKEELFRPLSCVSNFLCGYTFVTTSLEALWNWIKLWLLNSALRGPLLAWQIRALLPSTLVVISKGFFIIWVQGCSQVGGGSLGEKLPPLLKFQGVLKIKVSDQEMFWSPPLLKSWPPPLLGCYGRRCRFIGKKHFRKYHRQ